MKNFRQAFRHVNISFPVALILAVLFIASAPASATTYYWNGGTGNWNTNTNWSPTGVPNGYNGDTAIVGSEAGNAVVNLYINPSVNRLQVDAGDEVRTVYNQIMQLVFTKPSSPTTVPDPTLINNGIVRLAYTGPMAQQIWAESPLTISGSGSLLMESPVAGISSATASITNGTEHTITGIGVINPLYLFNYGMVRAQSNTNGSNLMLLKNFYNYGNLSASAGATLQFGNSSNWFAYDGRSGGYIDLNGGNINIQYINYINNADIRNGQSSGGSIDINPTSGGYNSASFNGKTTLGSGVVLNINNNTALQTNPLEGNSPIITNDGVINLKAAGSTYSSFYGSDGSRLTGSGRIVLNGSPNSQIVGIGSTGLTQDVNHTIEGGGTLNGRIVNNGTIIANNGNLIINGPVIGDGQVNVHDGGNLVLAPTSGLTTQNLSMTKNATIQVGSNTTVTTGNFSYAMTDGAGWSWDDDSRLVMTGYSTGHYLEVGGIPDADPYSNNFLIPNLEILGDIVLVDLFDNQTGFTGPEALYVKNLTFTGSSLNLNNLLLYAWDYELETYDLVGVGDFGGKVFNSPLAPTVPLPAAVWLLGSGLLGLVGWRRFRKN